MLRHPHGSWPCRRVWRFATTAWHHAARRPRYYKGCVAITALVKWTTLERSPTIISPPSWRASRGRAGAGRRPSHAASPRSSVTVAPMASGARARKSARSRRVSSPSGERGRCPATQWMDITDLANVLTLHLIHLVQNLSVRKFFAKQAPTQKGMRTKDIPRPKFGKVGSFFFSLSEFFFLVVLKRKWKPARRPRFD